MRALFLGWEVTRADVIVWSVSGGITHNKWGHGLAMIAFERDWARLFVVGFFLDWGHVTMRNGLFALSSPTTTTELENIEKGYGSLYKVFPWGSWGSWGLFCKEVTGYVAGFLSVKVVFGFGLAGDRESIYLKSFSF